MSDWNPTAEPFRAMHIVNSTRRGCYGWESIVVGTYATADEARAACLANPPKSLRYSLIDFAANAATWSRNGVWRPVGKRIYPVK